MDFSNISDHMSKNLQQILPAIAGSPPSHSEGVRAIDLSLAENILLGPDILALTKDSINRRLELKDLSYPVGFGGDPELLFALACFLNTYFHPANPIQSNQIITTSGAGNALDALLCSICDPGDQVLVLGPCWEGFGPYFLIHANVEPVIVTASTLEGAMQDDIVKALHQAFVDSPKKENIKAVVVTNPSNPLGRCYSREVLRNCLHFCNMHGLHMISDEVYALSSFQNEETDTSLPLFTSVLSLLDDGLTAEAPSLAPRVHMIWSMSKDFGCSGIRMGCIVSQANPALRLSSGLATYWQTSSLASAMAKALLNSPRLSDLILQNSESLGIAYRHLTDGLTKLKIRYIPADHGLFIFARVGVWCTSFDDEKIVVQGLAGKGLVVATGQKFSCGANEFGWVRITFSTTDDNISAALAILKSFLEESK